MRTLMTIILSNYGCILLVVVYCIIGSTCKTLFIYSVLSIWRFSSLISRGNKEVNALIPYVMLYKFCFNGLVYFKKRLQFEV